MDHLDGAICWCNPFILSPCPLCDPGQPDRASCKRCNDSGVVRGEADDDGALVLHIEIEDEEGAN